MEADGLIPTLVEVQEAAVGLKPWDVGRSVQPNVALNVELKNQICTDVAPKDLCHRAVM